MRPYPSFVKPDLYTGVDPQSGYFYQVNPTGVLRVGRVDVADHWLFECNVDPKSFWPSQICASGGCVVLLDQPLRPFWSRPTNCLVFRPDSRAAGGWNKEERRLSATVLSASPFDHHLLCQSNTEMPMPSTIFIYDITTGRTADLGIRRSNQLQFVLAYDFLSERLKPSAPEGGRRR